MIDWMGDHPLISALAIVTIVALLGSVVFAPLFGDE